LLFTAHRQGTQAVFSAQLTIDWHKPISRRRKWHKNKNAGFGLSLSPIAYAQFFLTEALRFDATAGAFSVQLKWTPCAH
jgi:hypothetical protein